MITRAWAAGLQPRWVVTDEGYGHDYKFRAWLEAYPQPYVLAVPATQSVTVGFNKLPVRELVENVPRWRKLRSRNGYEGTAGL